MPAQGLAIHAVELYTRGEMPAQFRDMLSQASRALREKHSGEAERLARAALERGEFLWGPSSVELLRSLALLRLAISQRSSLPDADDRHRADEKFELALRSLRLCETMYGESHPQTADALRTVALCLESTDPRALEFARRALTIVETQGDATVIADARSLLASILLAIGAAEEAATLYSLVIPTYEHSGLAPLTLLAHHGLGEALVALGRPDEARAHLEIALNLALNLRLRGPPEESKLVQRLRQAVARTSS